MAHQIKIRCRGYKPLLQKSFSFSFIVKSTITFTLARLGRNQRYECAYGIPRMVFAMIPHKRQFKKTSVRSREFIAKRAFGIWHFGHAVGASFARDPASDVASKTRSYKRKSGFQSPPTRKSGTKLMPMGIRHDSPPRQRYGYGDC